MCPRSHAQGQENADAEGGGLTPRRLTTAGDGSEKAQSGVTSVKDRIPAQVRHVTEMARVHEVAQAGAPSGADCNPTSWNGNLFTLPRSLTPPHVNEAHEAPGSQTAAFCLEIPKPQTPRDPRPAKDIVFSGAKWHLGWNDELSTHPASPLLPAFQGCPSEIPERFVTGSS